MTESEKALDRNLAAFGRDMEKMKLHHMGKWVLFYDGRFIDAFDTLDNVASEAVKRYGRGPYLIKQVGAPSEMRMPSSVMFGSMKHVSG